MSEKWVEAQRFELKYWAKMRNKGITHPKAAIQRFNNVLSFLGREIKEEMCIVDVGSGPNGGICTFLSGRCLKICVDPLLKYHLFNLNKDTDCIVACGENLPIANNQIDIIFFINTLDHCRTPLIMLKEFYRALKKNGTLCLMVNMFTTKERLINHMVERLLRLFFWRTSRKLYDIFTKLTSVFIKMIFGVKFYRDAPLHPFSFIVEDVLELLETSGPWVYRWKVYPSPWRYKQDMYVVGEKLA